MSKNVYYLSTHAATESDRRYIHTTMRTLQASSSNYAHIASLQFKLLSMQLHDQRRVLWSIHHLMAMNHGHWQQGQELLALLVLLLVRDVAAQRLALRQFHSAAGYEIYIKMRLLNRSKYRKRLFIVLWYFKKNPKKSSPLIPIGTCTFVVVSLRVYNRSF